MKKIRVTGDAIRFEYAGGSHVLPSGESEVSDELALSAQARLPRDRFQIVHPEAEAAEAEARKLAKRPAKKKKAAAESVARVAEGAASAVAPAPDAVTRVPEKKTEKAPAKKKAPAKAVTKKK